MGNTQMYILESDRHRDQMSLEPVTNCISI